MVGRKVAAMTAVAALATLSLTACGSSGGGGGGGGKNTLSLVAADYGTGPANSSQKYWQGIADDFHKANPDITVKVKTVNWNDFDNQIQTAVQNHQQPDITEGDYFANYAQEGLLYKTSEVFSKPDNLVQVFANLGSYKGTQYGIPFTTSSRTLFYNKKLFQQAGLNPDGSSLATYAGFLDSARKLVAAKAAQAAIWPAPSNEFFQPWFDFYPLFAAESGGKQLVVDRKPTFNSAEGEAVAKFWRTLYDEGLAPREKYNGDAFADGKAAMAIVGPWAIAVYKGKVDWGSVPVPTSTGKPTNQIWTFSDAKNVALYSSCKNRATAWDLLKFATSTDQDGKLLKATGQMPLRTNLPTTYPDYFTANPAYQVFADQAARTVEVPNVPNSIKIWQTFRDAYSAAVIFGREDPAAALDKAANDIGKLAAGG
jgi:ABC-type glycerol-3-phosphate transport system substrate-binding protein